MASDCTYMNMSHACSSHQAVFALEINGVTADLLRLSYMVWSVWSSNGSLRTVWESHGCSFRGGWVHCQHWKLEGSPGELLAFRTRQKPEEADSALRERMQQQHRQTCHCYESKQAKQAFPFHLLLFLGCHQKVSPILRVGLLTSINPVKQIPHGIADSRQSQVDSQD